MAPSLSEEDIDDVVYFARAGELTELEDSLSVLAAREKVSTAEILTAARDEGKATCLHMATGNGKLGGWPFSSKCLLFLCDRSLGCELFDQRPLVLALSRSTFHSGGGPKTFPMPSSQPSFLGYTNTHVDVVMSLLGHFASRPKEEKQAFIDAQNEFGNTGLHWAALSGYLDVVKLLMEHGASPAIANDQNYIPLDSAGFGDKGEVVDYFLSLAGGIESGNQDGLTSATEDIELDGDEAEVTPTEEGEGSRGA